MFPVWKTIEVKSPAFSGAAVNLRYRKTLGI